MDAADAADKIGLLPGFGWIVNWGSSWTSSLPLWGAILAVFVLRWGTCLALTPYGHLAVGVVGEGRVIPIDSGRQFRSFYPGNLYLSTAVSVLLTTGIFTLPAEHHWYNSRLCHSFIAVAVLLVAVWLTFKEAFKDKAYPFWAVMSPSKWYCNLLLYGCYCYMAVSSLIAIVGWVVSSIFWHRWSWWSLLTIAMLYVTYRIVRPWLREVRKDGALITTDPEAHGRKVQHVHVPDWKFLGMFGPGSFRRTPVR